MQAQQHSTGCGIGATARLAGISYGKMLPLIFPPHPPWVRQNFATHYGQLRNGLAKVGITLAQHQRFKGWEQLKRKRGLLKVRVQTQGKPIYHWLAFYGSGGRTFVFDPWNGTLYTPPVLRDDYTLNSFAYCD